MTSRTGTGAWVSSGELDRVITGTHHDPHSVLGAHPGPDGVTVRALRPLAATVTVLLADGRRYPMEHAHGGIFGVLLPDDATPGPGLVPDYRLAVAYPGPAGDGSDGPAEPGPETVGDDPYRHRPTLGEIDLHLIGEGRHEELWRVLGAHVRESGDDGAAGPDGPPGDGVLPAGGAVPGDGVRPADGVRSGD
ncbi:MAG TPA: hypothetical protein VGI31_07885, partial [Streptosporangiaceae bacterium]